MRVNDDSIEDKLCFLSLAENFKVERNSDGSYTIASLVNNDEDYALVATIENGVIDYCIKGIYNSGCDYVSVDMGTLEKLKEFVKLLSDDWCGKEWEKKRKEFVRERELFKKDKSFHGGF